MSGKPRLQFSDDVVALADAQELVAVIVNDLLVCELGICRFGALQLDGNLLIGVGLAETAPAYPLPPSTGTQAA
jgi:hypothetical protein